MWTVGQLGPTWQLGKTDAASLPSVRACYVLGMEGVDPAPASRAHSGDKGDVRQGPADLAQPGPGCYGLKATMALDVLSADPLPGISLLHAADSCDPHMHPGAGQDYRPIL